MKTLRKQGYWLICLTLLGLTPVLSMAGVKKKTPRKKSTVLLKKKQHTNPKKTTQTGALKSYVIKGKRYYVLNNAKGYNKVGEASWYGPDFHGKLTASGERYDQYAMTAASPNLPLSTYLKVTNLENGRSVVVKITDRGPFKKNRILDLSYAAAKKLGYAKKGTAHVQATVVNGTQFAQEHTTTSNQPQYAKLETQQNKRTS